MPAIPGDPEIELRLRARLPGLFVALELREAWSSSQPGHRALIREGIARRLRMEGRGEPPPSILDLDRLPEIPGLSASISHCPSLGGFACVDSSLSVGLDIEVTSRVNERLSRKIATREERAILPDGASLWVAKEAVFKACARLCGAYVISGSVITAVAPGGDGGGPLEFRARPQGHLEGKGWIFAAGDCRLAVFVWPGTGLPLPK